MSSSILVIDGSFDPAGLGEGDRGRHMAVVCLCWLAPSTRQRLASGFGARLYDLSDLVMSDMDWGMGAYRLAARVLEGGARYRGLGWRTYMAEPLYREALTLFLVLRVVELVKGLQGEARQGELIVEVAADGFLSRLLGETIAGLAGVRCCPVEGGPCDPAGRDARSSYLGRFRRRLREARVTGDWRKQACDLLEWADKEYVMRIRWGRLKAARAVPRGGITFFSSYSNNSRTLSPFAPLMPEPPWWVLTNDSARRGMPGGERRWSWIWEFHARGGVAPGSDLEAAHPEGEAPPDGVTGRWLARSPAWRSWRKVEFPTVRNLTRCWEAYLERARPRLVVMANQWGIEGWFTHIARERGVPVLQIIHGVLGGYLYTQTPIVSDVLVVPGEFWRGLWPEEERSKIVVFNPPGYIDRVEGVAGSGRPRLTYFSWPLRMIPSYGFYELTDSFIGLFRRLLDKGRCEITIRAHPLEDPSDLLGRWQALHGRVPEAVRMSKGEPLEQVLARTDVALMFRSTVMLDCMASGIPVVMPGWMDFGWNEAVGGASGIHLASGFEDLEGTLLDWLDRRPEMDTDLTRRFVMPAGEGRERFGSWVQGLMRSCHG